jgi:hypothetical protein
MGRLDSNWQTHVAALHFGVDAQRALQLLLEPEIEQAILAGHADTFNKLRSVPGFEMVMERLVERKTREPAEPDFVLSFAALLGSQETDSLRAASTWTLLTNATADLLPWIKPFALAPMGLRALIKRGPDRVLKDLIGTLSSVPEEFTRDNGEQWLDYLVACIDSGKGDLPEVLNSIRVPGGADTYLLVLLAATQKKLGKTKPELVSNLRPSGDPSSVITAFADWVTQDKFDAVALATYRRRLGLAIPKISCRGLCTKQSRRTRNKGGY